MAIIQSGISPQLWTIDPVSEAGRVTLYDINGNAINGIGTVPASGVLSALSQTLEVELTGQSTTSVQLYGTTGSLTVSFQATINDGYSWFFVNAYSLATDNPVSSTTGDGVWFIDVAGYHGVRLLVTSYASGSTNAVMIAAPEERQVRSVAFLGFADNSTNSTNKAPVMPARANASAPTWTEGNQVPLSVDTAGNLRITGTISATSASVSATGSAPPASATYIAGSVTTAAPTYTNGTLNALSLTTAGLLRIDGSGVTQPISAASLPLPTGAATETTLTGVLTTTAFQARINTLGQKTMAASTPVVLASDQSTLPVSISGTVTTQDNTSLVDNAGFTDGTSRVSASGYIFDEVAGTALTENDIAAARVDSKRAQVHVIEDATTRGQRLTITAANAAKVDGSAVTQPISAASLPLPTGAATETTLATLLTSTTFTGRINTLGQKTMANSTPVVLASDQTVIPVSQSGAWTVTSNIGTTNGLALDATLTGGTATTRITDGTNTATVKAASTSAIAADKALVVAISPNNTVSISGTVTSNIGTTNGLALDATLAKLTISQSTALGTNTLAMVGGSVTTAAPAYTNGNINPLSLTTTGALRVDGSSVTQPISAASLPLPTGAATETTLAAMSGKLPAALVGGRLDTNNGAWLGSTAPTVGSKTSANSIPVVIASDQGAIAITGTVTATNASTSATGAAPPASATYIGGSVTTAAPTYTTGQMNALSLTTAGALRIDGSGVTQPISAASLPLPTGAATETTLGGVLTTTAFQARINTLGQKTMANSTPVVLSSDQSSIPVTGTFFQATQPVSGTVTANIGTTNGLALDATLAKLTVSQSAALGTNTLAMVGGSVTTAAPTYTTGNINPLSLTTTGLLRVDGSGVTQPVSGTVTVGNLIVVTGTATDNSSNVTTKVPVMAAVATTAAPTWTTGNMVPLSTNTSGGLRVDGSGVTQPVSGTVTSNIGTTNGLALDTTLSTMSGKLPAALVGGRLDINSGAWFGSTAPTVGSKTSANSIPVVIASDQGAITITGSVTASNPSVSSTGSAPPASATYMGGAVTTSAPAYTTGQMSALSLTTGGLLRVDISGADDIGSGTFTATAQTQTYLVNTGRSSISWQLSGTWTGTVNFEKSLDGTNWVAMSYFTGTNAANSTTTNGIYFSSVGSTQWVRLRTSAAWTGTAAWNVAISLGTKAVAIQDSIPTGANVIGAVTGSGTFTVNASATVGLVDNAAFVDGTTRVQPNGYILDEVAGTALTENDVAAARVDSKRAQIMVIEDGVNRGTRTVVKGASTAAVAADAALVVTMSPNSATQGITGTIKPLYGTNNQTVTITLASLTNGSARASTVIDNSSNLYDDVYLSVRITTAAAGTSATGFVNVYAYGSVDGGTTYPEAITGTDAGVTLTNPTNLVLIAQFNANTNGATKTVGPFSFCRQYGVDRLPNSWGIVIVNNTGATFNATGGNHFVKYQGVNAQLI